MRPLPVAAALALAAAAAAAGGVALSAALADGTPLQGSVGPGFAISLQSGGSAVTHLDPGAYALTVDDKSDLHSFHLTGPGVDVDTLVEPTGTQTFALNLVDGTYTFFCDAHPLQMKGAFTVGSATTSTTTTTTETTTTTAAPPPGRLTVTVIGRTVTLKGAGASAVRRLRAGAYVVKVTDRSKTQNAHLSGAGVNRRTGLAFTGAVSWRVTLKHGTLVVGSDGKGAARPARVTVS